MENIKRSELLCAPWKCAPGSLKKTSSMCGFPIMALLLPGFHCAMFEQRVGGKATGEGVTRGKSITQHHAHWGTQGW